MKPHVRPVAAAIAGSMVNSTEYNAVWCHEPPPGAWRSIKSVVKGEVVEAFDHDRACHITGMLPNGVFHHGDQAFLQLTLTGVGRIEGYDHGTQTHFVAEVRDHHVQIFDEDGGAFHAFTLR